MLDIDEYVNKNTDAETAADSYGTYIRSDLTFPDSDENTVQEVVMKSIRKNGREHVGVLNLNPLFYTGKYMYSIRIFLCKK